MTGRDPRRMSPDQLEAVDHQRMSAQEALRLKCLHCAGSPNEVCLCVAFTYLSLHREMVVGGEHVLLRA